MEIAAYRNQVQAPLGITTQRGAEGCAACMAAGGMCQACVPTEAPTDTYTPGERPDDARVTESQDDATASGALTDEEQRQVAELQARDTEVRTHEAAHQSAGGGLAGAASFTYQSGPDGQRYAIGGEVPIDVSAARDPAATIAKMARVKAAALAPASPSSQDLAIATQAEATAQQARAEQAKIQAAYSQPAESTGHTVDVAA